MNLKNSLILAIVYVLSLVGCAEKTLSPDVNVQSLERDWVIEKDMLFHSISPKTYSFTSIQVFRRHSLSASRIINFGSFPKAKMHLKVWHVPQSKLKAVLNSSEFKFNNLLNNPNKIKSLSNQINSIGKTIGDVSNSRKHGDGHFFANGSARLYGGGTVPRVSNIPDPLNQDYRVVVLIESSPMKNTTTQAKEITVGRSYSYKTNSAIQIIQAVPGLLKNKKPFYNFKNKNLLNQKIVNESPTLANDKVTIGVNKESIPYDHHINIGWQ